MDQRLALAQSGYVHRGAGGHDSHDIGVDGHYGFQQIHLALGESHMGVVQCGSTGMNHRWVQNGYELPPGQVTAVIGALIQHAVTE